MDRFGHARMVQVGKVVTSRRYLLLTVAATGIAAASAAQRLHPFSSADSVLSMSKLFAEELMSSRVNVMVRVDDHHSALCFFLLFFP